MKPFDRLPIPAAPAQKGPRVTRTDPIRRLQTSLAFVLLALISVIGLSPRDMGTPGGTIVAANALPPRPCPSSFPASDQLHCQPRNQASAAIAAVRMAVILLP